jgi:protein-tyrosine phosphatase
MDVANALSCLSTDALEEALCSPHSTGSLPRRRAGWRRWPGRGGGDWLAEELAGLQELRVDTLVSFLTAEEITELGLDDEANLASAAGLRFQSFPIRDYAVPPLDAGTVAYIEQLAADVLASQTIAMHCRMGIGRSSLIAASILTILGIAPSEAFARISAARGRPVPDTDEQRQWVDRFAATRTWLRL